MADVFISYQSKDRASAMLVAQALTAEGYDPWWDPELRNGQSYDAVIEQQLRTVGAVIVLWSPHSAASNWVRAEATIAQRRGVLLPAMLEPCELPVAFELMQTADLTNWWGDQQDWRWRRLMEDLAALLTPDLRETRVESAAPFALAAYAPAAPKRSALSRFLRNAGMMALAGALILFLIAFFGW